MLTIDTNKTYKLSVSMLIRTVQVQHFTLAAGKLPVTGSLPVNETSASWHHCVDEKMDFSVFSPWVRIRGARKKQYKGSAGWPFCFSHKNMWLKDWGTLPWDKSVDKHTVLWKWQVKEKAPTCGCNEASVWRGDALQPQIDGRGDGLTRFTH